MQVKDKKGHVFGGFAADPWGKHGTFYGNGACFLFTLLPEFRVFFATGYNTNFQWCGYKFSQLPNGVGFGGQVGYYSLLIESSLDTGMSRPSATFGSPCLASAETFDVDQVEVWLVEQPEEDLPTGLGGSALDKFKEDKHLLEVAGVQMHSDGYRHRPPEPIA
jgi:TLD